MEDDPDASFDRASRAPVEPRTKLREEMTPAEQRHEDEKMLVCLTLLEGCLERINGVSAVYTVLSLLNAFFVTETQRTCHVGSSSKQFRCTMPYPQGNCFSWKGHFMFCAHVFDWRGIFHFIRPHSILNPGLQDNGSQMDQLFPRPYRVQGDVRGHKTDHAPSCFRHIDGTFKQNIDQWSGMFTSLESRSAVD